MGKVPSLYSEGTMWWDSASFIQLLCKRAKQTNKLKVKIFIKN